jgi:hypothetical protein
MVQQWAGMPLAVRQIAGRIALAEFAAAASMTSSSR